MVYLISMKVTVQNQRARYVNLMLCFMQTSAPILSQVFFAIATAQEPSLRMIIKGYAAIALVLRLDDMFAGSFPRDIVANAAAINKDPDDMKMKDSQMSHNSTVTVCTRFFKAVTVFCGCHKTEEQVDDAEAAPPTPGTHKKHKIARYLQKRKSQD